MVIILQSLKTFLRSATNPHLISAEGESQKSCSVVGVLFCCCCFAGVVCFANVSISSLECKVKPERCYLRDDRLVVISSYNTTRVLTQSQKYLSRKRNFQFLIVDVHVTLIEGQGQKMASTNNGSDTRSKF